MGEDSGSLQHIGVNAARAVVGVKFNHIGPLTATAASVFTQMRPRTCMVTLSATKAMWGMNTMVSEIGELTTPPHP